jgi:hypothetical protein
MVPARKELISKPRSKPRNFRPLRDADLQAEIDHEDRQQFGQAAENGGVDVGRRAQRADFRLLGEGEEKPMTRPIGSVQSASVMVTKKPLATSSPQPVSPQDKSDPSGSRLRKPWAAERIEQRRKPIQLLSQRCRRFHLSPDPCRLSGGSGVVQGGGAGRRPLASERPARLSRRRHRTSKYLSLISL